MTECAFAAMDGCSIQRRRHASRGLDALRILPSAGFVCFTIRLCRILTPYAHVVLPIIPLLSAADIWAPKQGMLS